MLMNKNCRKTHFSNILKIILYQSFRVFTIFAGINVEGTEARISIWVRRCLPYGRLVIEPQGI